VSLTGVGTIWHLAVVVRVEREEAPIPATALRREGQTAQPCDSNPGKARRPSPAIAIQGRPKGPALLPQFKALI
jgi:hypothetical protein